MKRSVEETEEFGRHKAKVIDQLGITDSVFDEAFLFPMQDEVALNPEIYQQVEDTGFWFFATQDTGHFPSLHFIYRFDNDKIYLVYVSKNEFIDND